MNQTESIDNQGWDNRKLEKLWRYNLHYFDDLNAIDASERTAWHRTLIRRWVAECPPRIGTGWEPYPASLRIVNWIKWSLSGNELPPESLQSLAVQARWLTGRLETHLLGNHLLANAKALVFAGSLFDGPEAGSWLETGLRVLKREIPEQILPDGGHFERSTMYHALALEDILDLCNVARTFSATAAELHDESVVWRARIGQMRHWLAAMSHPDGEIGFFNDAAFGIAPPSRETEDYATRLGFGARPVIADGVTLLPVSGYVRIELDQAVVIVDTAPIGPDYLPAHAHADTLSFELSLFGERVLVNSGTSLYLSGDERARQRGTAAHNTVVINGENSSEVWGSFRVARRARPVGLSILGGETNAVRCSHDGYGRLRGSPQHTRTLMLTKNALIIEDEISGSFRRAEARFHLHPAIQVQDPAASGDLQGEVALRLHQGKSVHLHFEGGVLRREATTWHPEFGVSVPTTCLVNELRAEISRVRITWNEVS